jgi:alpha-L-arabinofuranosidase
MRTRIALLAVAALSLGRALTTAAQQAEPVAPNPLMVTIGTAKTAEPVSKYEFGMFIEHIGPLIYRSLWSEMLDDRKFYFPITSKESAAPPAPQGDFDNQLRKWRPVGPDDAVVMNQDKPFTGEQSPRILLDAGNVDPPGCNEQLFHPRHRGRQQRSVHVPCRPDIDLKAERFHTC